MAQISHKDSISRVLCIQYRYFWEFSLCLAGSRLEFVSIVHQFILIDDQQYFQADRGTRIDLVKESARIANAHVVIMDLPRGYETALGEGGNLLSGGQPQRIGTARATGQLLTRWCCFLTRPQGQPVLGLRIKECCIEGSTHVHIA